jgi:predicted short-subunit dehydrogenase-like oxidoreductase (DUF2520 family)
MDAPPFRQIGVIGAGRAAQALAFALAPHSDAPPLLWGRSPDGLRAAVARIGCAVAAASAGEIASACDVIVIAVSDDAVAEVAADLARTVPPGIAPFACHLSGRSGAAILDPLRSGALTAAIHPAMTFTGQPQAEALRMAGARFAITGSSPQATAAARRIVAALKGVAVEISEDRRPLYHAALCHASNHLVTLIAGATDALGQAGVDDPAALLAPLVRAALDNSLDHGMAGLSGPLLRGDARTIGNHLAALGARCARTSRHAGPGRPRMALTPSPQRPRWLRGPAIPPRAKGLRTP